MHILSSRCSVNAEGLKVGVMADFIVIVSTAERTVRISNVEVQTSLGASAYTEMYTRQVGSNGLQCTKYGADSTLSCDKVLLNTFAGRNSLQLWETNRVLDRHAKLGPRTSLFCVQPLSHLDVLASDVYLLSSTTEKISQCMSNCEFDVSWFAASETLLAAERLLSSIAPASKAYVSEYEHGTRQATLWAGNLAPAAPASKQSWSWRVLSQDITPCTANLSSSHRFSRKDSRRPKGYVNAFNFFACEHRVNVLEEFPDLMDLPNTVNKILGQRWRELSPNEKQKYLQLEASDIERFSKEYKQYRPEGGKKEVRPQHRHHWIGGRPQANDGL
mmetsp:Transcript_31989/g.101829  ORF Transcript_31989/g.101829 Transcript_31989/m.101829 type:complete len:331 (+) Transcript_31989:315-1307(+)